MWEAALIPEDRRGPTLLFWTQVAPFWKICIDTVNVRLSLRLDDGRPCYKVHACLPQSGGIGLVVGGLA
jgi:hypothetical protein